MSGASTTTRELFDPEFLAAVQRLRIVARRVARGGRHAEQRSKDLGSGLEFRDFRPYSAGDDLRAVDWNVYRRLGRVFLKLFEELEDLPVYLLPDVSASLFFETPPRAHAGLRAALALGAIALGQHDRVGVFSFAEELDVTLRPQSGRARLFTLAEALGGLVARGGTDFAAALGRFAAMRQRPGLAVVISDFFDPGGVDALTGALKRLRHRLLLVQLVRASDRDPDLRGDLRLIDCESGHAADVSATPAVVDAYRAAYDRFADQLARFASSRAAGLLRLDVEGDVLAQLATLFETGSYELR